MADNAGDEASIVVGKILDKNDDNYGYNAQTSEYGDMIARAIVVLTRFREKQRVCV
ncbi:hypothetical protein G8E10_00185 [Rhizobiaceae bacterium CRRU44]|uniref:Uncharacterized protein n=1 Tax=Ferranicluibacter rubi TaxID=2715133 RepID=A0AA43ZBX8_9HYPH|nr:hypothetical protein [Ferranicluibacter rubi]NHT74168.1 hypothetical protein [Ferranicluibacter rubi]